MAIAGVDLTRFGAARLRSAVQAAIRAAASTSTALLPTPAHIAQGAKATLEHRPDDSATYFQSILELGWLVASADGFADEERQALAQLLEEVAGHTVDHDTLELHFKDLADGCEMLGRRERLRRAAEDFAGGASRGEALGFAAIVALADGALADAEARALVELGLYLGFSEQQVQTVVDDVVSRLRAELES